MRIATLPRMGRVTGSEGRLRAAMLALGLTATMTGTGCTVAVLEASAKDPTALAFLPVALIGDLIGAAIDGGGGGATAVAADPRHRHWQDPDDWVGSCDGPLMCPPHKVFACSGASGDCYCECVVIGTSMGAMASAQ